MAKGPDTYHVVPHPDGGWAVKRGGSARIISRHRTKQDAVDNARKLSRRQGAELRIHNKDGKISDSDSHGNDPFPPKG